MASVMSRAALSLLILSLTGTAGLAQSPPYAPETMATALPAAWDGSERKPVEVTKRKAYGAEYATVSSRYVSAFGKSPVFELVLRITDMGPEGARMYRNHGADYLKGDVSSETEKSLVVAGRRALRTTTSANSLNVVTFVEPRILVETSCIKAEEAVCVKALERVDLARLSKLAP